MPTKHGLVRFGPVLRCSMNGVLVASVSDMSSLFLQADVDFVKMFLKLFSSLEMIKIVTYVLLVLLTYITTFFSCLSSWSSDAWSVSIF